MPALTLASTIRLGLALLLLACGLALLGAVNAEAAWLAPLAVSSEVVQGRDPQIAVDSAGDVTVAWVSGTASKDIYVAEHPAGGAWTSPTPRISEGGDCETPWLAVNPAGAAVLVADCGTGATAMRYATRSAAGAWGASSTIAGTGEGSQPRLAIDDAGDAVLVWEGASHTVKSVYKPAASGWSSATTLTSKAPERTVFEKATSVANVVMSHDGYALAVWREKREETGSDPVVQVRMARKEKAGAWTLPGGVMTVNYSTTPVTEGEPQLNLSSSAKGMVSWARTNTRLIGESRTSSSAVFGGWSEPAASIAEAGAHVELPLTAIDDSGLGVAAWRSFEIGGSSYFRIKVATTSYINSAWSTPVTVGNQTVTNPNSLPVLALGDAGNAIVTWENGGTVYAVTRPAGGSFGAATTISSASQKASHLGEPTATKLDRSGDSVVAWTADDATNTHIAVAVDDVTPPSVSASAPATATTGTAVAMTASAVDAWSPVSLAWDFGDGATATGASVSHAYATAGAKTVTVTATDAAGNSATATASIQVSEPSGGGVGGGGNGGGAGGGGGKSVALTVKLPKQAWKQIAKAKAIKLKCKLEVAGICRVKATVAAGLAKGLGLAKAKAKAPVKVGAGSASAKPGRFAVVKVKLTAKALAKIGAATRKVPVKLAVIGSASERQPSTATKTLPIKRP